MATFLKLVQDLERESGTIQQAARLTTVLEPVGRHEKMVEWVREAWEIVQQARGDWPWRRAEFEAQIATGQANRTPAQLGITSFSKWEKPQYGWEVFTIFDTAIGAADETPVILMPWSGFDVRWRRGVNAPGRPVEVSIAPDNKLWFGPTPDRTYTLTGRYVRGLQPLVADGDIPICPPEHHNVILWRALMLCGDHDESPATVQTAFAKFQRAFRDLIDATLDEATL